MRVFLYFLVGVSLTLGDKLDRTYLPPPGSKLSGGSDGDLLGPLDYSRPSENQLGSQKPEYETPISNVSTQFGQQRPSDQGVIAKGTAGQVPSGTRRPYQETQQGSVDGSVPSSGSDQGPQTNRNEPLSRLPIPGIRANTKYQVTPPQRATTPKYNPTSAPSRFDTEGPFNFDPSEGVNTEDKTTGQPSNTRKNFASNNKKVFDKNIITTPVEDSEEEHQANDYEKFNYRPNQKVFKPESTGRYPQDNFAGEKDYYPGSHTTARPSTFAPKDQSYYSKSKPTVPSRIVIEPKSESPAEYYEEYPKETVSGPRDFNRQGYPTTTRPSTFAPKGQTSYSKSKTGLPSRVVTETKSDHPTQYSEEYPQENVSNENNFYGKGTSTARPSTFMPKDQTYYSKQKTVAPFRVDSEPKSERPSQYSQGNASDENNYYRQGTSTIQPDTFAPEEEKYYSEKESTPAQTPDVSRVKSGRPTFGKPTYSTSTSRPVQPESDFYDQYSTTSPEIDAQDDNNGFEDSRKSIKSFSSDLPSIDQSKGEIKSQYTTASPFDDVTDSDFEEGLIKAGKKYGQNVPKDAQDVPKKPFVPTVPALRNQGDSVPEYNRVERPQAEGDRNAVIINYQNEITPEGNFAYNFDTSNGIHADESGTASDGVKAHGEFSYTGDDGKFYSVIYSADENGFQPRGDHLPTPPPIPEAILRVIEQAQRDKEAGISNDGSYDETKYGYKKYNGPVVGQPKLFDKTQEAFVMELRPSNKQTQGKYDPFTSKNDDSDDNKDYLDVEKVEDEAYSEGTSNQDDGHQYARRPINKNIKENQSPGVSRKQERVDSNAPTGKYYASRKPTVEVRQDDDETVEYTNVSNDPQVYPNVVQKEATLRPDRIQNKYDSSRRGPLNIAIGQNVTSDEFVRSGGVEEERVPGFQKGIKVAPAKSPVKSYRFPEQKRRPYFDTSANDESKQIHESNIDEEEVNATPGSFLNKNIRAQSSPIGPQSNQDRFVPQKNKPGSKIREEDFDSERRTPTEKSQERYYETNRKAQRYPTENVNKPTNVKVDDFGRKIESEVSDITGLDNDANVGDFDSIKPSTSTSTQQKIAAQNRYNQRPTGTQGSGYDYIPPKNKFIQEPSRTLTKYTTDGKKIILPSVPADVSNADEEEETAEQPKNVSEDKTYNGPVNQVTGKPRTKSPRPAAKNPIDSEYEYQKQYNKLFGQEPERFASVTSTTKPFFAPISRVTYKPTEGTGFDDQVNADEEKEFTAGIDFNRNDKDEIIAERPTQSSDQRLPSRTYSTASRPGFNQKLRPNGEVKESFGGDYEKTDEEIQEIPTQSLERPSSDRRPPTRTYNKTPRPGSNQVRPNEYKVPSTTYRPVFSFSVTENEFEDSNYPTESAKAFDNENRRIPSNVNVDENSKIRPVGSITTPETDGSRFVTETKTVGEDFSGPQRPQYYDPETGYHY